MQRGNPARRFYIAIHIHLLFVLNFLCVRFLPVCVCMHTLRVHCPQRPEDGVKSPGTGVTNGCETPCSNKPRFSRREACHLKPLAISQAHCSAFLTLETAPNLGGLVTSSFTQLRHSQSLVLIWGSIFPSWC